MKILDIPQSGKRGLNVSQAGQFGQISRTLAIPANPRTDAQMSVRDNLSRVAARWRALTEPQRVEWMEAATAVKSTSRLGQSGNLSGFQLFAKINCTLKQFGGDQVDTPPVRPQFADLAVQGLVITNTAGVVALKLTCPTNPGENTIVRGSKPVSQGVEVCKDFRILGRVPPPPTVRPTSRASIRPVTVRRRSAPRCTSRSTRSLMGGRACPGPTRPSSRRAEQPPGVRAVEQWPAPGVQAGGCPPGHPPAT